MARKSFIENEGLSKDGHCIKRVRIRSYSGPHFSRIRTEYGETLRISPYSVRMRENADQSNSEYGKFSGSVIDKNEDYYSPFGKVVSKEDFTMEFFLPDYAHPYLKFCESIN